MAPIVQLAAICLLGLISAVHAGSCQNPSVRREWSAISEAERVEWVDAVKCLTKLPHSDSLVAQVDPALSLIPPINTSSSLYDDFVYVHMDQNIKIHFTGLFLPWHRSFLYSFESALKEKCGYKGAHPYWNWTVHADDFIKSPVFSSSTTSGFGGNGNPDDDLQIAEGDGAFSTDFVRPYPVPHRIRRNITMQPWAANGSPFADQVVDPELNPLKFANTTFTPAAIQALIDGYEGDFEGFQAFFEFFQGAHAAIHSAIGADMFGTCPSNAPPTCVLGPKWSPNDPLFFMHHGMVDKIWYDWQLKHKANFWSYRGGSVQALEDYVDYDQNPNGVAPWLNFSSPVPSSGMFPEYSIYEMMDTTGDTLCYVYE